MENEQDSELERELASWLKSEPESEPEREHESGQQLRSGHAYITKPGSDVIPDLDAFARAAVDSTLKRGGTPPLLFVLGAQECATVVLGIQCHMSDAEEDAQRARMGQSPLAAGMHLLSQDEIDTSADVYIGIDQLPSIIKQLMYYKTGQRIAAERAMLGELRYLICVTEAWMSGPKAMEKGLSPSQDPDHVEVLMVTSYRVLGDDDDDNGEGVGIKGRVALRCYEMLRLPDDSLSDLKRLSLNDLARSLNNDNNDTADGDADDGERGTAADIGWDTSRAPMMEQIMAGYRGLPPEL